MTHLIPIGNSLGVRIPKAIIAQIGMTKETPLTFKVVDDGLLIAPAHPCREGWETAFKKASKGKKEKLLLGDIKNQFDEDEWEW
jgi:antitoxin MazE